MARGNIITKEQVNKMIELTLGGMTRQQVAEELGCSSFAVYKKTKGMTKNPSTKRLTEEEKQGIREMRKQGYKQQDIADKFNCSLNAVHTHCKDIKIETKKMVIIKAIKNGVDLEKLAKKNGYDWGYVCAIRDQYSDIEQTPKRELPKQAIDELEKAKAKALIEEQKRKRKIELEELRLQEIVNFRWGGTVKIC